MIQLNDYHRAILRDYADGDFAHLASETEVDPKELGDTLLVFLLVELSAKEGCESVDDAQGRVRRARDDLDVCLIALRQLKHLMQVKLEAAKTFQGTVVDALNAMRDLTEASTDVLLDESQDNEEWENHPSDAYREIGLKAEQQLMELLEATGIPAVFDRNTGTWKLKEKENANETDRS